MDEVESGPVNVDRLREDYLVFLHAIVEDFRWALNEDQVQELQREINQYDLAFPGDVLLNVAWVHFPSYGKVFDKTLSSGSISGAREHIECIPFVDTVFCGAFSMISFADHVEECGTSDFDPNLVLLIRQLLYFYKKFKVDWEPGAEVKAAREFWSIEASIREPHHPDLFGHRPCLTDLSPSRPPAHLQAWDPSHKRVFDMLKIMQELADRFASVIPEWSWDDYDPRHGPGAVSDLPSKGGDKYTFPNYPEIISEVFPADFFCQVGSEDSIFETVAFKYPAALAAVPKTYTKPRLIASEPVVHQFFQQALMQQLRRHLHPLLRKVVEFHDQGPSRALALEFSSDSRGATVDLSSASDRLSLFVVQCFYRTNPPLLDLLERTRSNAIRDTLTGNDEVIDIRKFAAMGSGVTFPVQTVVYAAACFAAVAYTRGYHYRSTRGWLRALDRATADIQVFGDDIEIPSDSWQNLEILLTALGLKVNHDKTHTNGYFRESCGMDAYRGYDVTPAYISHESPYSIEGFQKKLSFVAYIEQSNNAHRKGLWHLAAAMRDRADEKLIALTPVSHEEMEAVSLFSFIRGTLSNRFRFHKRLHRYEVRGFKLSARRKIQKRDDSRDLLQFFIEGADRELDHTQVVQLLRSVGVVRNTRISLSFGWSDARCSCTPRKRSAI